MRILKGQEILPDDSTLVQHNISDGNTVNVLIEPEHDISIEVQCGPKVYKHEVNYCMTVNELKTLLIENEEVAFLYREFDLVENEGTEQEQILDDDTLPLHYFISDKSVMLVVLGPYLIVKSKDSLGTLRHHKVASNCTVRQLKRVIDSNSTNMSMFVARGNDRYKKLDETEDTAVRKLLSEDKTVHFITDTGSLDDVCSVYHHDKEVGQVQDPNYYDITLSVKLRIQEEMGIPVHCITVYLYHDKKYRTDDYIMKNDVELKTSNPYIEIK